MNYRDFLERQRRSEGCPSWEDLQPAAIYDVHTVESVECEHRHHDACSQEGQHSEYGVPDGVACPCACHGDDRMSTSDEDEAGAA